MYLYIKDLRKILSEKNYISPNELFMESIKQDYSLRFNRFLLLTTRKIDYNKILNEYNNIIENKITELNEIYKKLLEGNQVTFKINNNHEMIFFKLPLSDFDILRILEEKSFRVAPIINSNIEILSDLTDIEEIDSYIESISLKYLIENKKINIMNPNEKQYNRNNLILTKKGKEIIDNYKLNDYNIKYKIIAITRSNFDEYLMQTPEKIAISSLICKVICNKIICYPWKLTYFSNGCFFNNDNKINVLNQLRRQPYRPAVIEISNNLGNVFTLDEANVIIDYKHYEEIKYSSILCRNSST